MNNVQELEGLPDETWLALVSRQNAEIKSLRFRLWVWRIAAFIGALAPFVARFL